MWNYSSIHNINSSYVYNGDRNHSNTHTHICVCVCIHIIAVKHHDEFNLFIIQAIFL